MSKLIKSIAAGLLLTAGVQAHAGEQDWFFKPYVGGDVGVQHMDWETGFGDFHFRSEYPVTNFHVGVDLHQYVGVEAGYEHMYHRERHSNYYDNIRGPILGFVPQFAGAAGNGDRGFISNAWSNGFTLSLILKYPVLECTEVFATLGANWARMHYETMMIQNSATSFRPNHWKSDRHAIGRFGAGIRHFITPHFGGRLLYVYEGTSKLDASVHPGVDVEVGGAVLFPPTSTADLYTAKPKGSHLVMAGLFYQTDWF